MNDLIDKILFDWWYPVAMFPIWIGENNKQWPKLVRFLLFIPGYIWFFVCLPLTFVVCLLYIPLIIWEDL